MTPIANQRSEFNFDYTVFCPNLISNAGKGATACTDMFFLTISSMTIVEVFFGWLLFFTWLACYINEEFC